MSVTVGRAKLNNAYKDLLVKWEDTRALWRDTRAQQFERDYIEPLRGQIRSAVSAMERLTSQIGQCERDCS